MKHSDKCQQPQWTLLTLTVGLVQRKLCCQWSWNSEESLERLLKKKFEYLACVKVEHLCWYFFLSFPKYFSVHVYSVCSSEKTWPDAFFALFSFFLAKMNQNNHIKKNSIWRKYWKNSENEPFPMVLALPCPYRLTSVVFRMVVHKDQSSAIRTDHERTTNILFILKIGKEISHFLW